MTEQSEGRRQAGFSGSRQQRQTRIRQSQKKGADRQQQTLEGAAYYRAQSGKSQSQSRADILAQISGCSTGGEKWKSTGGRVAGAGWRVPEAQLI